MIEGISHIGVFVTDLEKTVETFARTYGVPEPKIVDVPARKKRYAMVKFGDCAFELLEDYDPESDLHQRAAGAGGFIHHVAFRSTELESDLAHVVEHGATEQSKEIKPGLRGKRIAFFRDKALSLTVELTEP